MTLVSHGVAGVFYVATVRNARGAGSATRSRALAVRAGFDAAAPRAWLGASEMGADLYRRIGFSDLGTTSRVESDPPSAEQDRPRCRRPGGIGLG